jgi:hypothetical protein
VSIKFLFLKRFKRTARCCAEVAFGVVQQMRLSTKEILKQSLKKAG